MNEELENKKTELEIKKLQAETKNINRWFNPNVLLNIIILAIGTYSAIYLNKVTDLKNERLEYDKKVLEYEIIEFKKKKDSISDIIDSLIFVVFLYEDSTSKLSDYNLLVNNQLKEKTRAYDSLFSVLYKLKESNEISKEQAELIKTEMDSIVETKILDYNPRNNYPTIYPNPSNDFIKIGILNSTKKDTFGVNILDKSGQLKLSKKDITYNNNELDIRSLERGLYMVHIYNEKTN